VTVEVPAELLVGLALVLGGGFGFLSGRRRAAVPPSAAPPPAPTVNSRPAGCVCGVPAARCPVHQPGEPAVGEG
jgi:hypothetical protein